MQIGDPHTASGTLDMYISNNDLVVYGKV